MNLVVAIKDLEGNVVGRISMPTDVNKIKYTQYLEFKRDAYAALNFFLANQETWYDDEANQIKYLQMLCTAASSWCGADINSIFKLVKGSEVENAQMIKAILSEGYDWVTTKDTLYGLFGIIYKTLMSYEPKLRTKENCTFTENGVTYTIPVIEADKLGRPVNPTLTVGQALTTLQKNKIYNDLIRESDNPKDRAQYELKRELTKLALMTDKVPDDPEKIEQYVNDTMHDLQNINMVNGLDLCFFLTGTMKI